MRTRSNIQWNLRQTKIASQWNKTMLPGDGVTSPLFARVNFLIKLKKHWRQQKVFTFLISVSKGSLPNWYLLLTRFFDYLIQLSNKTTMIFSNKFMLISDQVREDTICWLVSTFVRIVGTVIIQITSNTCLINNHQITGLSLTIIKYAYVLVYLLLIIK